MEKQEIFDQVVEHLARQKVQSQVEGICMYRGANNTKCAFGLFIPDSAYDPNFEGVSSTAFFNALDNPKQKADGSFAFVMIKRVCDPGFSRFIALKPELAEQLQKLHPNQSLLRDLQKAHDDQTAQGWVTRLSNVARDYRLTFDETAFAKRLGHKEQ